MGCRKSQTLRTQTVNTANARAKLDYYETCLQEHFLTEPEPQRSISLEYFYGGRIEFWENVHLAGPLLLSCSTEFVNLISPIRLSTLLTLPSLKACSLAVPAQVLLKREEFSARKIQPFACLADLAASRSTEGAANAAVERHGVRFHC